MEADTTIMLWDYEITEGGDFYHDSELPLEQPTYQYCAVEVDKGLLDVGYQLLAKLYISEEDEELEDENGITTGYSIVNDLLEKAFRLTGNEDDYEPIDEEEFANARCRKCWNPHGRVRVWDDRVKRYVPVVGAKVRARRWFRGQNEYTNSRGEFRSKKVNYSIRWERYHYGIRSGTFGQAWYNDPKKKKSGWYVGLGRSG